MIRSDCNKTTRVGSMLLSALALGLSAFKQLDKDIAMAVVMGTFTVLGAMRASTSQSAATPEN
jgi:hypothetical protein